MKLHYLPGSRVLVPHIVLEWLGIDFDPLRITRGDAGFLQVNPPGVVPALEHGGKLSTQADAMLRWGHVLSWPLADCPALAGYLERWLADDGVQRAFNAQGLVR